MDELSVVMALAVLIEVMPIDCCGEYGCVDLLCQWQEAGVNIGQVGTSVSLLATNQQKRNWKNSFPTKKSWVCVCSSIISCHIWSGFSKVADTGDVDQGKQNPSYRGQKKLER